MPHDSTQYNRSFVPGLRALCVAVMSAHLPSASREPGRQWAATVSTCEWEAVRLSIDGRVNEKFSVGRGTVLYAKRTAPRQDVLQLLIEATETIAAPPPPWESLLALFPASGQTIALPTTETFTWR